MSQRRREKGHSLDWNNFYDHVFLALIRIRIRTDAGTRKLKTGIRMKRKEQKRLSLPYSTNRCAVLESREQRNKKISQKLKKTFFWRLHNPTHRFENAQIHPKANEEKKKEVQMFPTPSTIANITAQYKLWKWRFGSSSRSLKLFEWTFAFYSVGISFVH